MMRKLILASLAIISTLSHADRIKDVGKVSGDRTNVIVGYGLVTGLAGTGDKTQSTDQTVKALLERFNTTLPDNIRANSKNVAAVLVQAKMPVFAKPGQELDVTVSSIGDAKSLEGGTLYPTVLKGLDGKSYALASGSVLVTDNAESSSRTSIKSATSGVIAGGAAVERRIHINTEEFEEFTFNLNSPDFSNATTLANTINDNFNAKIAKADDNTSVTVIFPDYIEDKIAFISAVENLPISLETPLSLIHI